MTFSIVARGGDGVCFGVAVASKFLAVGAVVPAAETGAGALATQSYANLAYRPDGLALLRLGHTAAETAASLTGADDKAELRQLGIVDAAGGSATYTGPGCQPWAGGRRGADYAIQGNILTGEDVVADMETAWLTSSPAAPLATRLLAALSAGDAAGGDRRGRQSAALLVVSPGGGYGGTSDVMVDLRVDDHPQPVPELWRLLDLHDVYFGRPVEAEMLPLQGELLGEVRRLLADLGHATNAPGPEAVTAALWEWAGAENLEERVRANAGIDPAVLKVLRTKAGYKPSPSSS